MFQALNDRLREKDEINTINELFPFILHRFFFLLKEGHLRIMFKLNK